MFISQMINMQEKIIWTIGQSTHPFDEFFSILKSFEIQLLIDIRGNPGSRRDPHFNKVSLQLTLPESDEDLHMGLARGRRKKARIADGKLLYSKVQDGTI